MSPAHAGRPIRILLVEEDPGEAQRITDLLRGVSRDGFVLERVDRFDGAMEHSRDRPMDVVLIDLDSSSGPESFERATHATVVVPIIVISAIDSEQDALTAVRAGAQDYLVKGRTEGQLLVRVIRHAIERKRADVKLQWLTLAVEQSPAAVFITDPAGTIQYVNRKFTEISGYTADEAIGQNPRLFQSGLTPPEVYHDLWSTIRAGEIWQGEVRNRRKSGELYWDAVRIAPMRDARGTITHFVAVQEDITDAKRLQEQLLHSQKMESVGLLAGGVAHDFNNLLTVILNNAEFVQNDLPPASVIHKDMDEIRKAADRAAILTRQLLSFARRQVVRPRRLDLNDIATAMDKMLRRLIGEDIELVTRLCPEPWAAWADPSQIEQIMANLAVNSRDAMPNGGKLTIETANITLGPEYAETHIDVVPGDYVMLAVSDTGLGIPDAIKARIFDPYFTTKEEGKGTGLGLATVHGIVRAAGGHIWLYSEPGQGTTFKIYLPRATGKADPIREVPSDSPRGGSEIVLIVEDEQQVLEAACRCLRPLGYTVVRAQDGFDGLRVCEELEGQVDLLLTDIVMPRMGGPALADLLRERYPLIKVLYTSGYAGNAAVLHEHLSADAAFLAKPYVSGDLARKVRQVLDSPRA